MRVIIFIYEIFKKFPALLVSNILLIIGVGLFGAFSLFTIGPVVDIFMHPDLRGVSPLTAKAVEAFAFFNLPVNLTNWLVVFVLFIVLSGVFEVMARYSILKMKYAVLRDLIVGTFEDFLNARWLFFSSEKQGMLLNTFNRELTVVGNAFSSIALLFAAIIQFFIFLAVPFYISWQVTSISLCAVVIFVIPFALIGRLTYKLGKLNTSTANELSSVIQESLSLAKIVLGFGNQEKCVKDLKTTFNSHCKVTLKSQIINIAIPTLYKPFGFIMAVIALFSARHFNVPLSEITVLLLGLLQASGSIGSIASEKNSIENFFPSYEQVKSLRGRARKLRQTSGAGKFLGFNREVTVKGLNFAYNDQAEILNNINMRIFKGKMIAIVGESGSGKSTLIDAIMGFHDIQKGTVCFDGVPLQDFNIYSYRRKIGYVPQDSVLFNITIRDNLLWANETASEEDIIHACDQANATEFIDNLPDGFDTLVGDRGVRLSGGQVQRIALARAILRKPELLMLDEATSALDTYSERLIQQAIENIAKETTVIVIAHRLSTIVNADYIYVLKEGKVAEEGTYPELINKKGYFNNMVELQALNLAG